MNIETECPGKLYPREVLDIISSRYYFAGKFVKNKNILEVGCGPGVGLNYLSSLASHVFAGEYSKENIMYLVSGGKHENVSYLQLDGHMMPFLGAKLDVVLAMAMVYYLDFYKFLSEVKRVLKPGGELVFCTSNKDVPGFVASPYTVQYYNVVELEKILSGYGFSSKFYGAFPKGKNLFLLSFKAIIKKSLKFIITNLPHGAAIWKWLRNSRESEKVILPNNISSPSPLDHEIVRLSEGSKNKRFRVIYVYAKYSKSQSEFESIDG